MSCSISQSAMYFMEAMFYDNITPYINHKIVLSKPPQFITFHWRLPGTLEVPCNFCVNVTFIENFIKIKTYSI